MRGIHHPARRKFFGKTNIQRRKYNAHKQSHPHDLTFNLSKCTLSKEEINILNRGLNFVPTSKPRIADIDAGIDKFNRRMQIQYFFFEADEYTDVNYARPPDGLIKTKSTWQPKKSNRQIDNFTEHIRTQIHDSIQSRKIKHNLSKMEKAAIDSIKQKNIVIRPCDKGAGICILEDADYISKCNKLLDVGEDYEKVDDDPTLRIYEEANSIVRKYEEQGILKESEVRTLVDFTPRTPCFYGNVKIHKDGYPMRPIVSQVNGPTSHLSELADVILAEAEAKVPELLKDTMAFLQSVQQRKVSPNAILATLDVTSLYTRIDWDEGVRLVADHYEETVNSTPRALLTETMNYILKNNFFTFNNQIYHQKSGTSMGSKFSVRYANIYMYRKWIQLMASRTLQPCFQRRLIDDIIIIWEHGEDALNELYTYLNGADKNIKFEMTSSKKEVHFLDTYITINEERTLETKVYTKPTDRQSYLHFNSDHPDHVKKAIPYGQALRIRRITTKEEEFQAKIIQLTSAFIKRGYKKRFVEREMKKVNHLQQVDLINYKPKKTMERTPLVIPYSSHLIDIRKSIKQLWIRHIAQDSILANIFRDPPIVAFTRGRTIGAQITSSTFPPKWRENNLNSTAEMLCQLALE